MFGDIYRGRRVLITGHTGFKGAWLSLWLHQLGANVSGFSDSVPTTPSLFEAARVARFVHDARGDIRDAATLGEVLDAQRPEVVFHLAAQSLVRSSYENPVETFSVNTMGTITLLDQVRRRPFVRATVIVTSDKVYRNEEWEWGYRETDVLGGRDPYSGSKSAADIATTSFVRSYFAPHTGLSRVATVRAGNVIGGGDWAAHRIVPDAVRAWGAGQSLEIRNPAAIRPWQHVLESLGGYLLTASQLLADRSGVHGEAFNFGPEASVNQPVEVLIRSLAGGWPGAEWHVGREDGQPHEAHYLKLSSDKALARFAWQPALGFSDGIDMTRDWYRAFYSDPSADVLALTNQQIAGYRNRTSGMRWTQ